MLFELLYVTQDEPPEFSTIQKVLKTIPQIRSGKKDGNETVFPYRHEDTLVRFDFVRYSPGERDEVGLAFEMTLPRPTFFAQEALPVAILVARELKLSVDVLLGDGSQYVEKPTIEALMELWQERNLEAARESDQLFGCLADDLESMWEYSLLRGDLSRRYGRSGVKVPSVHLVREKRSGKVGRATDWEKLSPVVLGAVEWIRLVDPPKPLQADSYYAAEELVATLKPLVRTVPQPIFHHLCDKRGIRDELTERIGGLKRKTSRSFDILEIDQIVDQEVLEEL